VFDGISAGCDGNSLESEARDAVVLGQYGEALQKIELAIRCKPTQQRYQQAFMYACNSKNAIKAKYFYSQISNPGPLAQMCVRNGIGLDQLTGEDGYVVLASTPSSKILIDGQDTGLVTPITGHQLPLTPGKHKVTFLLGDDRYTYAVNVRAGETVSLDKNLQ